MPIYPYECDKEDGGCGYQFEKQLTIKQYEQIKSLSCPKCKKRKPVRRIICNPLCISMGINTIGALADRNAERLSEDEKHHLTKKHNEYREVKEHELNPLPEGMTRGRDLVD